MSTRRERLERKLEKREEWAESREAKSDRAFDTAHTIADGIPMGQPILAGHHSERHARRDQARIESNLRAGVDHHRAAEEHRSKADGLRAQLATSVYSDDEDAVERLNAQVAELEAERDRIKAYNASCRKGTPDTSLLDDAQRAHLESLVKHVSWQLGKNGALPSYMLSNLGATIRQKKQRAEQIACDRERVAAGDRGRGKPMISRYAGTCADCGEAIEKGDTITWYRLTKEAFHAACPGEDG